MKYILELNNQQLAHLKLVIANEDERKREYSCYSDLSNWHELFDKVKDLPYERETNPDFADWIGQNRTV